jgi:hypothetical protein
MRIKFVLALFALVGLSSFVAFGSPTTVIGSLLESVTNNPMTRAFSTAAEQSPAVVVPAAELPFENKTPLPPPAGTEKTTPAQEAPPTVLWHMIFSLSRMTERQAERMNQQGRSGEAWSRYFIKRGALTAENEKVFKETAEAYLRELEPIDRRAKEVTAAMRARYPKGLIKDPKDMPQPPAELGELQKQKDALALRYRDSFKNAVSREAFDKFNAFLTNDFAKGVSAVSYPHPNKTLGKKPEEGSSDEK